MKILIFNENYYCGGMDSFIINLINYWPNIDDEISLYCNASHPGLEVIRTSVSRRCEFIGYKKTSPVDFKKITKNLLVLSPFRKILSFLQRYFLFLFYIKKLHSFFQNYDADRLIVVNGGHPASDMCRAAIVAWGMAAGSMRPLALYNFHNLAIPVRWFEKFPEKIIDRLLLHYSRSLVGVSKSCSESLRTRLGNEGMKKVSFIYNGIPLPPDSPVDHNLRKEIGIPHESLLCSMLATYEPRKGHEFLLKAFKKVIAKIPNVYLLICGYGPQNEFNLVKGYVENLGLSKYVSLQGFRRDADSIIKQSDLVLVPSQAYESFGLTCVEAMANKVPVVATTVGGLPEVLLQGEGGFCSPPDDVEDYAKNIIKLLKDSALRKVQGEKGFQRFQKIFFIERMTKEYADLVRKGP